MFRASTIIQESRVLSIRHTKAIWTKRTIWQKAILISVYLFLLYRPKLCLSIQFSFVCISIQKDSKKGARRRPGKIDAVPLLTFLSFQKGPKKNAIEAFVEIGANFFSLKILFLKKNPHNWNSAFEATYFHCGILFPQIHRSSSVLA